MLLTTSCTDADGLEKVEGAGGLFEVDGVRVQRMHNGLLIEEGGYGGQYVTENIRSLQGHHEPQEEVAFDLIIRRLQSEGTGGRMIEFGSFWAFYSMWFGRALPDARMLCIEPDPSNLEVGRRNAAMNGLSDRMEFVRAAIGSNPGELMDFPWVPEGVEPFVTQVDLGSLLERQGWDRIDIAHIDVQGAETVLLQRAAPILSAGRVRFVVVSTHHHSISGDALTHQRNLALLIELGGHVIAEHSVEESFSGDGLIVVSFDRRDVDLVATISYARAKDSLFGELEPDLDAAWADLDAARADLQHVGAELGRVRNTRLMRWSAPARSLYGRLRRR